MIKIIFDHYDGDFNDLEGKDFYEFFKKDREKLYSLLRDLKEME